MTEVIATVVSGQEAGEVHVLHLGDHESPNEWIEGPPSTVPMIVSINGKWQPTGALAVPGVVSFAMPKREAAALAISLNRREVDRVQLRPAAERTAMWSFVCLRKHGFAVVRITVNNFRPTGPFELPDSVPARDFSNCRVRRALRVFNGEKMAAGSPRHWCIAVKRLTVEDLMTHESLAAEGGAA